MNYTFEGREFFFVKFCASPEIVEETLRRCKQAYKTQGNWISKRVLKITDQDGNVIMNRSRAKK